MPGWKEISDFVLKHDYCCGCGVCSGLCPQNVLEMHLDTYEEYKPRLTGPCTNCGLCSRVCPFVPGGLNEDDIGKASFGSIGEIKHTPETGYYLACHVGHAADPSMRWAAASGGLLTWTLAALLKSQSVDYVVCVRPSVQGGRLFELVSCESDEEVRSCAKSCYYPVELSGILHEIQTRRGRCAIVGLPCVLKALRKAEEASNRLRERILYHLGLVCGQQKSAFFTEYMCCLGGGNPRELVSVTFRVKDRDRPASDYGLSFRSGRHNGGEATGVIHWTEGMREAWCRGWFKLNACDYCDDLFAEAADAAYMDAWLPPYATDPLGTNLVIVRHPGLVTLFREGKERNDIRIAPIDVADVVRSQQGGLSAKRENLAQRLTFAGRQGVPAPRKRVQPLSILSFRDRLQLRMNQTTVTTSKRAFQAQKAVGTGLWLFRWWMRLRLIPLAICSWVARLGSSVKRRLLRVEKR